VQDCVTLSLFGTILIKAMNLTIALKAAFKKLSSKYIKLESLLNDPTATTYQIKTAKEAYFKALAELDELIRHIQSPRRTDEVSTIIRQSIDEIRGMLGVIFALSQNTLQERKTTIENTKDSFMLKALSRHIYDFDSYTTQLETNQFTQKLLDAARKEQFKNVGKARALR
jgi:hypothetical protein